MKYNGKPNAIDKLNWTAGICRTWEIRGGRMPEIWRKRAKNGRGGEGGGKGGESEVAFDCNEGQCGRVRDAISTGKTPLDQLFEVKIG